MMTVAEKWAYIQQRLDEILEDNIGVDGIPGHQTADAVMDALGWEFSEAAPDTPEATFVNEAGLELMRHFESCLKPIGNDQFTAYPDPGYGWQVPTIGWGTTVYPNGQKVKKGDVITQDQADRLFDWEIQDDAKKLRPLIDVALTNDQYSAITSFAYNVGVGAFKRSTLRRKLNSGDFAGAAREFRKWNKSNGRVLAGLTRRRLSEERLFKSIHPAIVPG